MDFQDIFIKDADFASAVQETILPFMDGKLEDGYFVNTDGLNIHYQYKGPKNI